MKKILVLILSLVYLATSAGATVHLHYCMGKLIEQNLQKSDNPNCSNCGMDKAAQEDGCCKHTGKQLKGQNPHNIQEANIEVMQLVAIALPTTFIEFPEITFSSITEENPSGNAPPRSCSVALYKRNCVFRI